MKRHITVAGNGSWGTALATLARRAGHVVSVWSRTAPEAASGAASDAVILAVPAQAVRGVLLALSLKPDVAVIVAAKGIERESGLFMHQVVAAVLPYNPALILSGPSFAGDVEKGLPTAVTLAGPNHAIAGAWAAALSLPTFRIYGSDDLMGVAIGGAMKNVLAIACGISDGRRLGESARAALITRGFAELTRFGRALGARPETLMGLSGLGDLMLTCSSPQSRNYSFGRGLGEGRGLAAALAEAKGTVEGAYTASVAARLHRQHGIEMPIVDAVHAIVDEGSDPNAEIEKLLARPVGVELK